MKFNNLSFAITIISSILIIFFPSLISSQTCKNTCGNIPIRYPISTAPGCGDPRFQPYITCNDDQLTFTTHTGCYPITSIDYNKQVIYISDPSMSTCACTQPSKGFSLDSNAPFSFHDDTIFALLDCSINSSPVYNNSSDPLCDPQGAAICSELYSCQAISRIDMPVSTCCVYTPVNLGPSFEMDLNKLECKSYSSVYGFNGQMMNPEIWNYGIALKYKFNFHNDYPIVCAKCEKSHGVCGYNGLYNSFICNCPSGLNTSTDCFLGGSWSDGFQIVPWQRGIFLIYLLVSFIIILALV